MLQPLSLLYGTAVAGRTWWYDRGWSVRRLPIPVVSVGNITTGGTGKTPMVIALAQMLATSGVRVAVVSRGYGRKGRGVAVVSDGDRYRAPIVASGDELAVVAERVPRAIVIAARRRYDGARVAHERYGAELVLLDDGFQHRQLARTLDIVMVDAATLAPQNAMLPAGTLREPLSSLQRAHILCALGVDAAAARQFAATDARIVEARQRLVQWNSLHGESIETPRGEAIVVCAIARPERFRALVEQAASLSVRDMLCWRDHHWYSRRDVERIIASAQKAPVLVTTEKDAVKLRNYAEQFTRAGCVVAVARMALEFPPPDEEWLQSVMVNLRGL
ncbi:MAG: tetraacyldisaccharide 4'-kinase [Candidatus Kapaibacterium sp.]|nr:MAG: tetraacyldisaccharide 4'-kinase [Candidatus Kapabacteria bacterium]